MTESHDARNPSQSYEIGRPPMAGPEPADAPSEPRPSSVFWLTGGHFAVDYFTNMLPPLLPIIHGDLGFSLTAGATIASLSSFISSLVQPIFGYYIDRRAAGWFLVPSVLFAAVWSAAIGLSRNYWPLMIFSILAGLGSAFYHPLGSVTLTGQSTRRRGWLMAIYSVGGSLGYAIGPMVSTPLVARFGLISFTWMLPFGLAVAYLMQRDGVGRLKVRPAAVDAPGLAGLWRSIRPNLSVLVLLNLVAGLRAWALFTIAFLIPLYYFRHGYPKALVSVPLSMFLLIGTAGSVAGGFLSDRLGRKLTIIASLLFSAGLMTVFGRIGAGYLSWFVLILVGAAFQAVLPATIVFAQELFPTSAGMASGMMMGLAAAFGSLGLTVTGYVSDHAGLGPALAMVPIILIMAAGLGLFLPGRRRLSRDLVAGERL